MWEPVGYRSWLTALSRALWGLYSNFRGSLFLLLTSEAVLPVLVALTPENATRVRQFLARGPTMLGEVSTLQGCS